MVSMHSLLTTRLIASCHVSRHQTEVLAQLYDIDLYEIERKLLDF